MIFRRPTVAEDEPFLKELFASTRAEEFGMMPLPETQREALIDMQFRAQRMQYAAIFPNASTDVLLIGETQAGVLTVDRSEAEIRLVNVAFLPEHRNRGYGSSILKELIAEAVEAGKPLTLHVATTNRARALYERFGFTVLEDDGMYLRMSHTP